MQKIHTMRLPALAIAAFCVAAAAPVPAGSAPAGPTRQTARADGAFVDAGRPAQHVEWGYTGESGPAHWSELSKDYAVCNIGEQESPIDLAGAIPGDLGKLAIAWQSLPLAATNNGHTVQFDAPAGSQFTMAGKAYQLLQLHIHHPSEHLVDGQRFPLEIHFVHKAPDNSLGVIAVLVATGAANPTLQLLLDTVPREALAKQSGATIDPSRLLPGRRDFYRYEGSLTTPPCSESVDWVVLRQPVTASAAQITQFAAIFPFNARPVQPIDRRFLLRSR